MAGADDHPEQPATSEVRTLPIHASLMRPILLAGADRELTLVNAVVCFALLFGIGLSTWTGAVVALLATAGQWGLGRVTRYDPDFRRVYARQIQLQAYYPAATSVHASRAVVHASIPYAG